MAGYMVCWPQDRWKEIQRAEDTGPIKVVYGSIHSRMPTIASIQVGDVGLSRHPDEQASVCAGPPAGDPQRAGL